MRFFFEMLDRRFLVAGNILTILVVCVGAVAMQPSLAAQSTASRNTEEQSAIPGDKAAGGTSDPEAPVEQASSTEWDAAPNSPALALEAALKKFEPGVPVLPVFHPSPDFTKELPFSQQIADANFIHRGARSPSVSHLIAPGKPGGATNEPRFDWHSLLKQSMFFLSIQHAFRFATEPGTRAELKGPFFKDWGNSIRGYNGWRDSDPGIVNYVGHPMMGSITGFMELQNERDGKALTFGTSAAYWKSRARAMGFSAVYSAQFELGPLSESSLGNVGLDQRTGGMVDLVVTPTIGTAWLILEDIIDRYAIANLEKRIGNRPTKIFIRGFLNPSRSFANMMAGKEPWLRHDRGGLWRNQ